MHRSRPLLLLLLFLVQHVVANKGGKGKMNDCMSEGIESKDEMKAYKKCYMQTKNMAKNFFKVNGTEISSGMIANLTDRLMSTGMECMMNRLPYVDNNGNISTTLLEAEINSTWSGEPIRDYILKYIKRSCIADVTGANFSEDYIAYRTCVSSEVKSYCDELEFLAELYYFRDETESDCAPLEVDPQVQAMFASATGGRSSRRSQGRGNRRRGGGRSGGRRGNRRNGRQQPLAPVMKPMEKFFRVAELMQFYSADTGFNFTVLGEYIFNLTNPLPTVQEGVMAAMNECQIAYNGDIQEQLVTWHTCLSPMILDICGFENNVTKLLFPYMENQLMPLAQEMAIEYIEDAFSFDSDDEDDDDDDEDGDDIDEGFFRKKREVNYFRKKREVNDFRRKRGVSGASGESGGSRSTESLELSDRYIL